VSFSADKSSSFVLKIVGALSNFVREVLEEDRPGITKEDDGAR
jgi:hypothetical protein